MTTAAERLMTEMAAAEGAERQHMADVVGQIASINEALRPLETAKRALTDELKQYLALNALDALAAPDGGYVAKLQDRRGTPTYDLVTLARDTDGYALIAAGSAGMLRIDHTMLARFRKDAGATWADTIARYEQPGTDTTALTVEQVK